MFYVCHFCSETVNSGLPVSEVDALRISKYLEDMLATTQKGEDRKAVKYLTRDKWMKFLNAAYAKFFNPVFPNHSGFHEIRSNYLFFKFFDPFQVMTPPD